MKYFILMTLFTIVFTLGMIGQTLRGVQLIGNNGTAVGFSGTVLHTGDGGSTWYSQAGGTGMNLHSVSLTDGSTGTAVGGDEFTGTSVIHTANGGSSWSSQVSNATNSLQGVSFGDANTGVAVGNHGTIIRTTNGGANWASVSSGTASDLISVSLPTASVGTAVGFNGVILHTVNGGASWSAQSSGTINNLNCVHFADANNGTAVGSFGTIRHTTNGGASWTSQSAGTSEELYGVFFSDANTGTIVGYTGTILRTTNGGSSWTVQPSGTIGTLTSVAFSSSSTGVAVGASKLILKTANGGASWSPATISSGGPPGAPSLSSPANGATNQSTTLNLAWNAVSGATSYRLQVSTSSAFTTTIVDDATLTSISRQVSGLSNGTTYYWRVNATSTNGTSGWSGTYNFTTATPINLPSVTTLAASLIATATSTLNGTVNPNGNATSAWFEWGTSSTLSTYSSTATQSMGSGTIATAVSASLVGLTANTTYYYRAAAQNSAGIQRDGILSFTTLPLAPAAPALVLPANSATNQSTALTLSWNASLGATSYRLQVSTSTTFSSLLVDDGTLTTTSRSVSGLANSTIYYWHVNATNSTGTSVYSGTWNFTTTTPPVIVPTVTTTAASSVTASSAVSNGSVNPNGAATTAWFEYGTNSTLSTFNSTATQSIGSGTSAVTVSANLSGLSASTTYYYRAAAQNSAGTQRDGIMSFTTPTVAGLPAVTTTAASSVTSSSSTFNGSVNPNGSATTIWFEYGTSSTLSTFSPTSTQSIGSGSSVVAVNVNLSGLSANTTYYYRDRKSTRLN